MKILFIYPSKVGRGNIPINIPILQASLKQAGHTVKIYDTNSYRWTQWGLLQTKMGMFKETNEDDYNQKLYQTDYLKDLENECIQFQPEIVAVSCLTTDFQFSLTLVRTVKQKNPAVISIYGGIHPTIAPDKVINAPEVDYVCVGEGEEALVELLEKISNHESTENIKNIWSKNGEIIQKNILRPLISMDKVPFQDLSGFEEFHFYRPFDGKIYRMANIEISRGCPFKCSYCINDTLQKLYKGLGKYQRRKSVDRVIDELCYLKDEYKFDFIRFWDEDFTSLSKNFLKELSEAYRVKVNLPFMVYARCETITEEKVILLKEMGCKTFAVGIESGSEKIRREIMNRKMSNADLIQKFELIHKHGVRVSAYNMIGLPNETRQDIFKTIELNRQCKPTTSSVTLLEPYPNTRMMEILVNDNLISPDYIAEYNVDEPHYDNTFIAKEDLKGLLKTFVLYIKLPKYLYPFIRICEKDGKFSNFVFKVLRNTFLR